MPHLRMLLPRRTVHTVAVAALIFGACASMSAQEVEASRAPVSRALVEQAARDLRCDTGEVAVEGLPFVMARVSGGSATHRAQCAGRQAAYICGLVNAACTPVQVRVLTADDTRIGPPGPSARPLERATDARPTS